MELHSGLPFLLFDQEACWHAGDTVYDVELRSRPESMHIARVVKITCFAKPQLIQVKSSQNYGNDDWMLFENLSVESTDLPTSPLVSNMPESPVTDSDLSLILLDALESCPHIITNGNAIRQKRQQQSKRGNHHTKCVSAISESNTIRSLLNVDNLLMDWHMKISEAPF
ncbi:hypothetical protein BDF19DRAFT_451054 [Syncephalis fuscata]|nr:hypothetical protein BDF19DRAFT_451054 [Syncephalis fuscata]